MRGRWIAACITVLCALPAGAQAAAPHWQLVADPAPNSVLDEFRLPDRSTLAVVNGTPYLAVEDFGGLKVYRANARRTAWTQLGGDLRRGRDGVAGDPDIASDGRWVWITWVETTNRGTSEVRVARLEGHAFREIVGGDSPINAPEVGYASQPHIVLFERRPYIVYTISTGPGFGAVRVARLSWGWRAFEHVSAGLVAGNALRPQIAVTRGDLYVMYTTYRGDAPSSADEDVHLARMNRRRNGWRALNIGAAHGLGALAQDGPALYASWAKTDGSGVTYRVAPWGFAPSFIGAGGVATVAWRVPYRLVTSPGDSDDPRRLDVEAFRGGAWQPFMNPTDPAQDSGRRIRELVSSDGVLWMSWDSADEPFSLTRLVHVARLVR